MPGSEQAVNTCCSSNNDNESYQFTGAELLMDELIKETERLKSEEVEKISIGVAVRKLMHVDRLFFPRKRSPIAMGFSSANPMRAKLPGMPLDPLTQLPYKSIDVWPSKESNEEDGDDDEDGERKETQSGDTEVHGKEEEEMNSKVGKYKRHIPDKMLIGYNLSSPHHAEDILMVKMVIYIIYIQIPPSRNCLFF
jgi:hypothetical protein